MKKTATTIALLRNMFTYTLMICLFVTSVLPAGAQATALTGNPPAAELTYIGSEDGKLVFNFKFKNESGEKCVVRIRDNEGNTFYSEKFSGSNISKRFILEKDAFDRSALTFILNTSTTKQTQAFELNNNTRLVEDFVVTKL
ncbi:MAG TPA: hypothetical protein VM843_02955 [Flavisolibacter sp.]|jgi:hypothetical protein|nr:hypothetical protein [Flavisolibacter sp.]